MPEIGVEDRVEVVLDRRGAGHVDVFDARRPSKRREHAVRVALRTRHRERRIDLAVDDRAPPGARARWNWAASRSGWRPRPARRAREGAPLRRRRAPPPIRELEDHRERAVGAVAELRLEDLAHVLGVGAGHGEAICQERRELRARDPAGREHGEPARGAHGGVAG